MLPWPDLSPEFPLPPEAASPPPLMNPSIIPSTSNVSGNTVPIEVWDQIVSYVSTPTTLFSLLSTCKRVGDVVLHRLYARPLESMGWQYHHPRQAFERFVLMVLTHSTLDNADTAFVREKLGITVFGQQKTYANYVSYIQQWDVDFARFVYLLKIIDSSTHSLSLLGGGGSGTSGEQGHPTFEWSAHVQRVHGALFWAMFEMHDMGSIRQIEVDYPDLDRLALRVDELGQLERLSICDMSDNGSRIVVPGVNEQTDEELDRRFQAITRFVELYIARHGNARLREIELNRAGLGRRLQEAKLSIFSHLMPLQHLRELNLNNWHRLMAKVDETDLSHVRSIELQAADPAMMVEWTTCSPEQVLKRCRELEHLVLDVHEKDIFEWAVKEQHGDEAKRLKHHPSMQPLPPVPLKSLAVSAKDVDFPKVIHDAVIAFGQTLTSVTSETTYDDPSAPEASELISIDGGALPSLRFLKMFTVDTLVLDSTFLTRTPKLQIMSLGDNVSWYLPFHYDYHQPWDLPRLKFLRLDGLIAAMFDPASLRNMPFLVGMALKGPYQAVEHDMELRRDFLRYDPEDDETPGRCYLPPAENELGILHNAEAWTWRWFMPQLSMIELKGEPAMRFHFRFLRWCPVLTELKLHIDRQQRALGLCDNLDEDQEDDVREDRKATKRAMGEEAQAKGEDAVPRPQTSPTTLLEWYEVDLFEYTRPGSTKAEDEERGWAWEVAAPRLAILTLTGRWSITDADIRRMLSNEAFPRLEELKLYRCQHYDSRLLCQVAADHRELKELIISRQWTRVDQRQLNVMQVDPPKKWRQIRGASYLYGEQGGPMWEQRFWSRTFGVAGKNFVKIKAKGRNFMLPKAGERTRQLRKLLAGPQILDPEDDTVGNDSREGEGDDDDNYDDDAEDEGDQDEDKENKKVVDDVDNNNSSSSSNNNKMSQDGGQCVVVDGAEPGDVIFIVDSSRGVERYEQEASLDDSDSDSDGSIPDLEDCPTINDVDATVDEGEKDNGEQHDDSPPHPTPAVASTTTTTTTTTTDTSPDSTSTSTSSTSTTPTED
ncbi:hypothetical protein DFQ27_006826, partial [Actinomortierella ambigua]